MNSRRMWDFLLFLIVISFIGFVSFMKIDSYLDSREAKTVMTTPFQDEIDKVIHVDSGDHFKSSLTEKEMNEKSDLVVIGQIKAIEQREPQKVETPSNASANLITVVLISDIIYDVVITESIKNPINESDVKVKCIGAVIEGFDPSRIELGNSYKFYLLDNKDGTYSPIRYKNGIQTLMKE